MIGADTEADSAPVPHNPLEQYVLLAKSAKGAACLELIKQVLEAPGVHVFGELLSMPNVLELESSPNNKYFNTLNLFAYGTYRQYLENRSDLLELSPVMVKKLQHLTIVTLAIQNKCIPYKELLTQLDISHVRDLEDLIIEAIYADIIHGKLDQKNSQLEVEDSIGRDIRPQMVQTIAATLQEWCDSCETVLSCIETQVDRANDERAKQLKHRDGIEQEIVNLKKAFKSQCNNDTDEVMATDSTSSQTQNFDQRKKITKKVTRSSGSVSFRSQP